MILCSHPASRHLVSRFPFWHTVKKEIFCMNRESSKIIVYLSSKCKLFRSIYLSLNEMFKNVSTICIDCIQDCSYFSYRERPSFSFANKFPSCFFALSLTSCCISYICIFFDSHAILPTRF